MVCSKYPLRFARPPNSGGQSRGPGKILYYCKINQQDGTDKNVFPPIVFLFIPHEEHKFHTNMSFARRMRRLTQNGLHGFARSRRLRRALSAGWPGKRERYMKSVSSVQSVDKEIRKDSCHLWEIKKHPSRGMSTHPRLRIPLP